MQERICSIFTSLWRWRRYVPPKRWHHNPEDQDRHLHHRENLKFQILKYTLSCFYVCLRTRCWEEYWDLREKKLYVDKKKRMILAGRTARTGTEKMLSEYLKWRDNVGSVVIDWRTPVTELRGVKVWSRFRWLKMWWDGGRFVKMMMMNFWFRKSSWTTEHMSASRARLRTWT
jgi:hypothetical protein